MRAILTAVKLTAFTAGVFVAWMLLTAALLSWPIATLTAVLSTGAAALTMMAR